VTTTAAGLVALRLATETVTADTPAGTVTVTSLASIVDVLIATSS
jgi:hypothetical protein